MNSRSLRAVLSVACTLVAIAVPIWAQTAPLAPCTVTSVTPYTGTGKGAGVCPPDFWNSTGTNPAYCYSAVMHCANTLTTPDLSFIFSYDTPAVSPLRGTVVFFAGGGGTLGQLDVEAQFAQNYFANGYEVVEIAWTTGWEQTSDTLGILTAASRPAGFLNYVLNTPLLNARSSNPFAGLCAQGGSAGSGAIGYALAWYGDSNHNYLSTDLDNVELLSGPVFSNIEQGCYVPPGDIAVQAVTVCAPGQYGCSPGTTQWSSPPQYIDGYAAGVRSWTNDNSCANGATTSSTSNQKWLAMSIVNGTGGSFSYPSLGMAGWLCASSTPSSCTQACPNNSAAEGQEFYTLFTSGSHPVAYKLTGIVNCTGAEGVAMGTDPDPPGNQTGAAAIESHMVGHCAHPTPP